MFLLLTNDRLLLLLLLFSDFYDSLRVFITDTNCAVRTTFPRLSQCAYSRIFRVLFDWIAERLYSFKKN